MISRDDISPPLGVMIVEAQELKSQKPNLKLILNIASSDRKLSDLQFFVRSNTKFGGIPRKVRMLLPGTKCPHPRPNSGRRYSHVDSAKSYSAQPRLNTLTIAPPQLTLTYGHLKLNHSRSRSNLATSGCSYYRLVLYLRSRF
jgi:hypothetical protein